MEYYFLITKWQRALSLYFFSNKNLNHIKVTDDTFRLLYIVKSACKQNEIVYDAKAPVTKYGRDYWINARIGEQLVKHFYDLANAREIPLTETIKPLP